MRPGRREMEVKALLLQAVEASIGPPRARRGPSFYRAAHTGGESLDSLFSVRRGRCGHERLRSVLLTVLRRQNCLHAIASIAPPEPLSLSVCGWSEACRLQEELATNN